MKTTGLAAVLLALPLLAGCLQGGPAPSPGGDGMDGETDATFEADGLVLRMARDRSAITPRETVHVNASVTNEGDEAVGYREGCPGHAWKPAVVNASGEEIRWRRSQARCLGFSWTDLEPGETVEFVYSNETEALAWNGTVWNGDRWVDAEPGQYRVRMGFQYTPNGSHDSGNLRTLNGTVPVTVEEG